MAEKKQQKKKNPAAAPPQNEGPPLSGLRRDSDHIDQADQKPENGAGPQQGQSGAPSPGSAEPRAAGGPGLQAADSGEGPSGPPAPEQTQSKSGSANDWEGKTSIAKTAEDSTVKRQATLAREAPPSLLLLAGPDDFIGFSWPLLKEKTSIGRSRNFSDISIGHIKLSKSHFQIIKEAQAFYVMDLKSTNKTLLDGRLLKPYQKSPLNPGGLIQASSLIFKFLPAGSLEIISSRKALNKAQTDPLTGAGNRQSLKIKGTEYFHSRGSLSLIVFDIDDFKPINDEMGHLAGDYVLKEISKIVMSVIREGDIFFRYGGDEFCILTPNSGKEARSIALRIQEAVHERDFSFKGKSLKARISIGVSERAEKDKKWEDIYHRADHLSYQAKRAGKARKAARKASHG